MPTKADFLAAAAAEIVNYPTAAAYYRVQDPRIMAPLTAYASMLAMLSAQMDNAQYEPFTKTRDATVLADATMKGILPLARSAACTITWTNGDTQPYALAAGRVITDPSGRPYTVNAGVTINPGESLAVAVTQQTERTASPTVSLGGEYYRMLVPPPTDTVYMTNLEVSQTVDDVTTVFPYQPEWFNVNPGDKVWQAETDEYRNFYVLFGQQDVVGYQPATGEQFDLTITECEGAITDLNVGDSFSLQYLYTPPDSKQTLVLASVDDTGQNPPDTASLRVMAQYPATYDHNAVYLGNFDFLVRRYLGDAVVFLSVWNEQIEEKARGPNVDNINTLFFAGSVTGMDDATFGTTVVNLIARADNSYKTSKVAQANTPVPLVINAQIAVIHDPADVASQISSVLLANYGNGCKAVSVGGANPINNQAIYSLLKANIAALQDTISDFSLQVTLPTTLLPEMFLYLDPSVLTINVTQIAYNTGLWSH